MYESEEIKIINSLNQTNKQTSKQTNKQTNKYTPTQTSKHFAWKPPLSKKAFESNSG